LIPGAWLVKGLDHFRHGSKALRSPP
jgi:hypothetical protein